jgi:hypothetical protein
MMAARTAPALAEAISPVAALGARSGRRSCCRDGATDAIAPRVHIAVSAALACAVTSRLHRGCCRSDPQQLPVSSGMDPNDCPGYPRLLWSVANLRTFLVGSWTVDRLVVDRARAMTGRLKGQARFTPSAGRLLYKERGILTFGEHRGPAEQSYVYEFPESDARASVRFRDGRTFHGLDLTEGEDCVSHACGSDLYEGLFTALSSTEWRSGWTVIGPRKDYDLVTVFTRLPEPAAA